MPDRKPARRKPNRHRETNELIGLWLVANFSQRPQNDYELVRPLAEALLCLYDDPQLRKLYRSHFDLADSEPIPNIPVDWMLAELTGMRLPDLERGRTTGRLNSCHVSRWTGRGKRQRSAIDLSWFAGNERGSEPELSLFMSLSDFPDASVPALLEFTSRFFSAAVATGSCYYGWGNLVVMAFRNWSGGDIRHHEPADLRVARESHLWHALGDRRRGSVLGANWIAPHSWSRSASSRALASAATAP